MSSWWGRSKHRPTSTSKHLRGLREGYGEEEEPVSDAVVTQFGQPIDPYSDTFPVLFGKFVRYLQAKAMACPSVFEKEVSEKDVQLLQRRVMIEGDQVQLSSHTKNSYVVAELFKHYLESMPEPLLTHAYYDSFISVASLLHFKNQLAMVGMFLQMLPRGYRSCVKILLGLLHRFSLNSNVNHMTPDKLGRAFARSFLRPAKRAFHHSGDEAAATHIVSMMIAESDALQKLMAQPKRTRTERELQGSSGLYEGSREKMAEHQLPSYALVCPLDNVMVEVFRRHRRNVSLPGDRGGDIVAESQCSDVIGDDTLIGTDLITASGTIEGVHLEMERPAEGTSDTNQSVLMSSALSIDSEFFSPGPGTEEPEVNNGENHLISAVPPFASTVVDPQLTPQDDGEPLIGTNEQSLHISSFLGESRGTESTSDGQIDNHDESNTFSMFNSAEISRSLMDASYSSCPETPTTQEPPMSTIDASFKDSRHPPADMGQINFVDSDFFSSSTSTTSTTMGGQAVLTPLTAAPAGSSDKPTSQDTSLI